MPLLSAFFSSGLPLLPAVLLEDIGFLVSAESTGLLDSVAFDSTLDGFVAADTSLGLMSFTSFSHSHFRLEDNLPPN